MPTLEETLSNAGLTSPLTTLYELPGEKAYRLSVPSGDAMATWQKLRDLVPQTRHWPVLLGEGPHLEDLLQRLPEFANDPTQKTIQEGLKIDVRKWLEERHAERIDEWEMDDDERAELEEEEPKFRGIPQDDWPDDVPPRSDFYIPAQLAKDGQVCIALLPTQHSWHVPALLRFGGWNDCPFTEEHVAMFRYWQGRFGAEVVGIAGDVVEMTVPKPPQDQNNALELAREQWIYCEEMVTEGTQTLEALAASLLKANVWFFWWE